MKFTVDKKDKYCIFRLEDEKLNTINAPKLKSELVILNAEGVKNIILDLSQVTFVDSSGLSAILIGNRLCNNINGTFVLAAMNDYVSKLIKISQLESILKIVPTVKEAEDYVLMEELERDTKEDKD
ncbi:MAG: anti-anti-sigma factor [Bacteroidetes bacterium SW_11_45_7]|nr:MAG: anti-anti-sigma factor [Bacteroidetes bacterium SW_11_45_7]